MLESALKEQLKGIFAGLEANFTFDISVSSSHENKTELLELLGDVADCSDHITCVVNEVYFTEEWRPHRNYIPGYS